MNGRHEAEAPHGELGHERDGIAPSPIHVDQWPARAPPNVKQASESVRPCPRGHGNRVQRNGAAFALLCEPTPPAAGRRTEASDLCLPQRTNDAREVDAVPTDPTCLAVLGDQQNAGPLEGRLQGHRLPVEPSWTVCPGGCVMIERTSDLPIARPPKSLSPGAVAAIVWA